MPAMPSRRRMRGGNVSVNEQKALYSPKKSASASPKKKSASASPKKKSASASPKKKSASVSPKKKSASVSPRKSPKELVDKMGSVINSTKSLAKSVVENGMDKGKSLEHAVNNSLTKVGQLPVISQVTDAASSAASSATSIVKRTAVEALQGTANVISGKSASKGGSRRMSRRRRS